MHLTAAENAERFFKTYGKENMIIVEVGSMVGGFDIRTHKPINSKYIGVDLEKGKGVDIILNDPYILPFNNNYADCVISTSNFEHIEMFWLMYLEIMRILKPDGLFYLNAPSCGSYHKFPVDCWRFYPDSAFALIKWGNRNNYNSIVLEQYTSKKNSDIWEDYIVVFIKDQLYINNYQNRILNSFTDYFNGSIYPHSEMKNPRHWGWGQ